MTPATYARSSELYNHLVKQEASDYEFRESFHRLSELLEEQNAELREALEKLLERANSLDQSATHEGLQNCKAIAQARKILHR